MIRNNYANLILNQNIDDAEIEYNKCIKLNEKLKINWEALLTNQLGLLR